MIYIVDSMNLSKSGLTGITKLTASDSVLFLYTHTNTESLSRIEKLSKRCDARFLAACVPDTLFGVAQVVGFLCARGCDRVEVVSSNSKHKWLCKAVTSFNCTLRVLCGFRSVRRIYA